MWGGSAGDSDYVSLSCFPDGFQGPGSADVGNVQRALEAFFLCKTDLIPDRSFLALGRAFFAVGRLLRSEEALLLAVDG